MKKIIFRGPVETISGYGARSRDLLKTLWLDENYDVKIDSCNWGNSPLTALNYDDPYHMWILENKITEINYIPDIYIQVTVPNEFNAKGKYNIGVTAGIETTIIPKNWIDGCNRMDKIIVSSNFSKNIFEQTIYNEFDSLTTKLVTQHKINKPIEVLFEGIDTETYKDNGRNFNLEIDEDFAFLFVGQWLKGDVGKDRKNIYNLIDNFCETFSDVENKPALILKTNITNFSKIEKNIIRQQIELITNKYTKRPNIYLLFGELSDNEMNDLYNHHKIKAMVSLTRGEGFGRPLLEFTMTGKPLLTTYWGGQKDFLPTDISYMVGGYLTEVDTSAQDNYIIPESKWFEPNYIEFNTLLMALYTQYEDFLENSNKLKDYTLNKFSFEEMKIKFKGMLLALDEKRKNKINIPNLIKIN